MKLIKGRTLEELLRKRADPSADRGRFVAVFEQVCQAVAYAHVHQVIHRDLKPGNIMVGSFGEVQVMDWGLAKVLTGTAVPAAADTDLGETVGETRIRDSDADGSDPSFTQAGSILGTLAYMPPEQAAGEIHKVDQRSDVFGLGAILKVILTGKPPYFDPDTEVVRVMAIRGDLAACLARLDGCGAEPELVALCKRCLAFAPADRPQDAQVVAKEVARFRAAAEERARAAEKERAAAEVKAAEQRKRRRWQAAGAALLVLGIVVSVWQAVRATVAEGAAVAARDDEAEQRQQAEQQTEIANQRTEELAWEDYINRVNRAYREVQDDNIVLAEDLLYGCPSERRDWEWHYVNRLCHPERLSVEAPAGSLIAIACSPDGHVIATGTGGPFTAGRGGPNVELWDRETGQRRLTLRGTEHRIWSLAFSPDGTQLAVGGTNPQLEVRDANTGRILWAKHESQLPQAMSVAYSPDGKSLAVGFGEYSALGAHPVKLYEVATGRETITLPGPKGGVNSLAFRPDGRRLAIAGSEVVEVWDVVARTRVHQLRGHFRWVYSVAFSPDGKWLATGGSDRTIKLWDAATGVEQQAIPGYEGAVFNLAFSPDSRCLASANEDRSIRLWDVPSGRRLGVLHGHTEFVQAVAFTPDGREVASGGNDGMLKLWDRRTSLPVVIEGIGPGAVGLWYRRDGRRLVISASTQGQVVRNGWNPSTGESDPTLTGFDRSRLQDEYLPYPVQISARVPIPTATSPDAKLLTRGLPGSNLSQREQRDKDATSTVEVLDLATGRVLHKLVGHTADVMCIAFSPDGCRIATCGYDRTVKLWNTATGREVFTLRGHPAGLIALAFSPDGDRIVSSGLDGTARVWDATPLPAAFLQVQEARYQQKRMELKERRDNPGGEKSAGAGNDHSLISQWQWERSAEDLEKSIVANPNNPVLRHEHILNLVITGNKAGVRRACENLLKRCGSTTDPAQAHLVAWSCVLAPDAVADFKAPVRLAEAALAGYPGKGRERSDVLKTLGAALYRAGQFEEAIRRLDESIQIRGDGGDPRAFAFLALAHHRLGHRDDVERWLDKLVACRPKEGFVFSSDDAEIRILHREAESLILGSRPTTHPMAPSAPTKEASGYLGAKP
jgi:WD40 repeat protein